MKDMIEQVVIQVYQVLKSTFIEGRKFISEVFKKRRRSVGSHQALPVNPVPV
jgi:hypothetical protein